MHKLVRPLVESRESRYFSQKSVNSPRSLDRASPIPPENSLIKRPTWLRGSSANLLPSICHMKQKRAGIIPYVIIENKIYFCFGIDAKSGEYTDYGGSALTSDGDITDTALRTLREKSFGIFRIYTRHLFRDDSFFVFDEDTLTILVNIGHQKNRILETIYLLTNYNLRLSSSSESSPQSSDSDGSDSSGREEDLGLVQGIEFQLKISNWFRSQKDHGVLTHLRGVEWLPENKVIEIISLCNTTMYSRLRCLIRDISKFVPIITYHPENWTDPEGVEESEGLEDPESHKDQEGLFIN